MFSIHERHLQWAMKTKHAPWGFGCLLAKAIPREHSQLRPLAISFRSLHLPLWRGSMQALCMTKIKAWVGDHPRGITICRGVRDILSLNRLPDWEELMNST